MTNKYSFFILCLCLVFCHGVYAQTNAIKWTDKTSSITNNTLNEGTDPEDNAKSAWQWGTKAVSGWKLTGIKGSDGAWTPEQNKFYHMVGVYDRDARTITLYRDGEKMGSSVSAKGKMVLAKSSDTSDPYKYHKFTLVGDPAYTNHPKEDICAQTIPSEVVMARMYDKVLTEAEVKQLYAQVKPLEEYEGTTGSKDQSSADLVTNVQYVSEVDALSSGSKFIIYADGLQSGDYIEFTNANASSSATKATTFTSRLNIMPAKTGMQRVSAYTVALGSATCTLPTTAATYKMTLTRGGKTQNLGYMRINSIVDKLNYGNTFGIVAHRGVHTSAPENSIEALKIAMENNLYASETDVVRTSDGTLVINHDNYFDNTTHKSTSNTSATSITGSTYNTIKDFTLTNGEKLPTLAMYLQAYKDYLTANPSCQTKLVIEIKQGTNDAATKVVAEAAFKQVNEASLFDKVEYISFSWAACTAMSAYTYNNQNPIVYYLCNNVRDDRDSYYMKNTGKITGGVDYNIYPTNGTVPLLEYTATGKDYTYSGYKNQGLKVNAYTINTLAEARTTLGRGCDFITANNPIELKMLKEYYDLNSTSNQ